MVPALIPLDHFRYHVRGGAWELVPWEVGCNIPPALSATRGQEGLSGQPTPQLSGACCLPFEHLCPTFLGPVVGLRVGRPSSFTSLYPHSPQTLPRPSQAPHSPISPLTTEVTAAMPTGLQGPALAFPPCFHGTPLVPQWPPRPPCPTHLGCG